MSIGDLPVELADQIIRPFCIYCTPGGEGSRRNYIETTRIKSLASLCLMSRYLNATATRHLYHYLPGRKWPLIARTLLARSDLAQTVKALGLCDYWNSDPSLSSPELVSYYTQQLQTYEDGLPHLMKQGFRYSLRLHSMPDRDNTFCDNAPVDIVASLCPNLESVEATLRVYYAFKFSQPASLPRLRTAVFHHCDTENGISLETLQPLFRAAPNLTSLTFNRVVDGHGGFDPPLAQLTHLHFRRSAFGVVALMDILRSCPRLVSFTYVWGGIRVGDHQFSLGETRDAVLAYAPASLELFRLSLAGNGVGWVDMWNDGEVAETTRRLGERGIRFQFSYGDMDKM
ncbi:hypothetical protein B0I37DRAFT_387523 [Chaetomium sp. MPI-CAGE-AT-0009]|nr:hypothetical protein B0I37DRAFT_387523 [Chaetomium sp. MPI-CAGE-AT-0009]